MTEPRQPDARAAAPRARRWRRRALALAAVALVAVLAVLAASRSEVLGSPAAVPDSARAPADARVTVEVLNATRTPRLARRATRLLRERGFDVVELGTSRETADTVIVLDRTGHPEWAARLAAAMGGARVESRPDSSRYVDLTVLVGASWRPPPETLYP